MSGYSTIAAEDGEKALALMDVYRPHLLVSDIKMPGKDGYELVRQVRQRPEFRLMPVIFLTERGSIEERIRGYQAGCDLYLPKPFEMEELGAVIRNLLERSQIIQSELRFSHLEYQPTPTQVAPAHSNGNNNGNNGAQVYLAKLTKREKEVLNLLSIGNSNIEIGNHLHLSPRTVEKHVSSLLRKTDTNNRAELIRFAFKHHLLE
jgi:DNA-binding NarL/FixJ family response regulator